ncbi:lipopolysaccharide biosynthesis protein [Aliivibrio logei]|uniref:lipopolysaccharide biosynthesis protein n=1 Tax=Aliivibrio logei TaxID=688 RepID=UPI0035C8FF17
MRLVNIVKNKISNSSDFNRNFGKLFSTSILIGLISAVCIPIIARIYTPEELGQYQLLLSVIVVFSSVSSFKYEMAIVLPKYKYQSRVVFQVALGALLISTIIYCILFYFMSDVILEYFNAIELKKYAWIVPIAIFITGLSQILQMCLVSNSDFNQLSMNKGSQSISNNILAISIGTLSPSFSSLLISYLASFLLAISMAYHRLKKNGKFTIYNLSMLVRYASKYKKFPTINTTNVFLNTMSMNLPIFVLSKQYSFEVVGVFMMANRLLDMPISLISGSLNQVYTKFAADDYKESVIKLRTRYLKTLKKLFVVSVFFCLSITIVSMFGIEIILGNEWAQVNTILIILMFSKSFQLMNSPLSSTLMIVNKQELGLVLILLSLGFRYISLTWSDNYITNFICYSIATSIFYFSYNLLMYKSIK